MKKKILCCVLAAILAFPVSALAADEEQTELSGDQRKATIMVLSITGNEMTYVEIDNDLEDESEPDSEGMRELESEEIPEPESGADNETPADPGGDGQMPQMGGNMEDMIEAFQENGGDMSQMEDMIESFQENGGPGGGGQMPGGGTGENNDGQMPGGGSSEDNGGQMPEGGPGADDEGQMPEDAGQPSDDDQEAQGGENGGPGGGGGMPQMGGNMEDMIEAFQENGGDMSQMQDMIEAFQENGGSGGAGQMPGGEDNGDQPGNGEEFAGPMSGATTVYLQVGLVVHADGKDKTFSILEAGDELEALFETDDEGNEVITEMWLLDN